MTTDDELWPVITIITGMVVVFVASIAADLLGQPLHEDVITVAAGGCVIFVTSLYIADLLRKRQSRASQKQTDESR